jgi:hypothetical protein
VQKLCVKSKLDPLDYGLISDAFGTWLLINQVNADSQMNKRVEFATCLAKAKVLGGKTSLFLTRFVATLQSIFYSPSPTLVSSGEFFGISLRISTSGSTLSLRHCLNLASPTKTMQQARLKSSLRSYKTSLTSMKPASLLTGTKANEARALLFSSTILLCQWLAVVPCTSKKAQTSTMNTRSNAVGESIPPHFQFPTKAQSDDTEAINIECLGNIHTVRGKFGCREEKD